MTEYVVDAGIFFRWYVEQIGFEHAREVRDGFLAGDVDLQTVDSVRIEFAHILRTKGVLKGRISADDYATLTRLDDLGVQVHSSDVDAVERAALLALRYNVRFFDAVVSDLALQLGLPLLTSDKRLANALGGLVRVEILRGM